MSLIILNVDEVRRTLSVSDASAFVVNDKNVDVVRFALMTGFADIALDEHSALRVMYQRPGETQVRAQTLTYYDTDGIRKLYDWELLSADLAEKGTLTVALCILRIDSEVEEWHTTPYQIRVLGSIHTDDSDEGDETITPTVAQRVAILESMIQRVASGAPIVVGDASEMVDTDKIYVLSTDGRWYYHNGSAWVAGGEYGAVATDTTLTQSGIPADAKKTGDEISDLKADLNAFYDEKTLDVWSLGRWASSTGNAQTQSKYIRTSKFFPTDYAQGCVSIRALTGYKFCLSAWSISDGSYVGVWTGTGFTKQSTVTHTFVKLSDVGTGYKFAISLTTTNFDTDLTTDAGANLLFKFIKTDAKFAEIDAEISDIEEDVETLQSAINRTVTPELKYSLAVINGSGIKVNYKYRVISSLFEVKSGDYIDVDSGYTANLTIYSAPQINSSVFVKQISMSDHRITADASGYGVVQISSDAEWSGPTSVVLPDTSYSAHMQVNIITSAFDVVDTVEDDLDRTRTYNDATDLFSCLRDVAKDWHFPFIDTTETGFGANHQIPNTAKTWSQSGTKDLTQKDAWMSDGTHLYRGVGTTDIYGLTIAQQLALVSPSFHDGEVSSVAPYWTGKRFLWMGTSIPAGSDPEAGEGTGATYPQLVATYLGATVTNIARGSSCVRANASDGMYTGFYFSHFLRSFTRMVDEADAIEDDWANIYPNIANAPSSLTAEQVQTMKSLSFENLLVPYLDGTNTTPDLFVIDYGHNDVRPKGIDGKRDLWIKPTAANIQSGLLAEDTYMTANNYANLKLAFDSDLSGITDMSAFAASVNRNCLQGALNFLITVILSYNPYARIIIISDYN